MTEVTVRRRRFLAALLGLIVFINTPVISAYAQNLYLGRVDLNNSGINQGQSFFLCDSSAADPAA